MMIRPVCSQLMLIILLALQISINIHISTVLAQEYSVEQIHIDELYVEGDENGLYTRVDRYTSKLSAALNADPKRANHQHDHFDNQHQPSHHHHQQQQELIDQHHLQDHNYHTYATQQQLHHETQQQVLSHTSQPQPSIQGEHLYQQNHQNPTQLEQLQHNINQPDTLNTQQNTQQNNHPEPLSIQYASNVLHHHHHIQLQHQQVYLQNQRQLLSSQVHQHTQIEWRRESIHGTGYSEFFMSNLETTYPHTVDHINRHAGSCNSIDNPSILMIHPGANFGEPTCQAVGSGFSGPDTTESVPDLAKHNQHTTKPSQNSNIETYPLALPHYHYENSLMTAIRHYWREISGLCLASAIFLNWLFVVVKRRFIASGFNRHNETNAEHVFETIQRYANSAAVESPKSLTKEMSTLNNGSAHDSAFEENGSPVSLDDASSSQSSSLSSRPRSSISSSPCCVNTSQPSLSLNNSSYTSDYLSRYSSDFDSIRRLGRGGFGIVFEAKNKIDDCHYAVKRICLPLEKEARDRVMREVRALAKLDHAGIVRYYNAWLETPPDEWLKQHDAQLGIVHTRDGGLSFPSTDGIYEKHGSEFNIKTGDGGDKFGESGDISNDFFGAKSLFKPHRTNGYSKYMNENSSSPSLDIVFEGSGSIRLEAENNTEESEIAVGLQDLHVEKVYLYIQMQLCRKDTLKDWLTTNCENRDKTTIFDFFYQIVDAVEYVHSQDLIHRDLKPSNIFFSLDGTLKIGDFGLCRAKTNACVGSSLDLKDYVAESSDTVHTEQVGTQLYMSPEQLNGLSYNHKVDIFAMGLILLELLVPFKTQMQRVNVLLKARNSMFSREFKSDHPDEHDLVRCLLDRRPYKRPTATAIKQHELLSSAQLSQPVIERIYHRRRTISSNSSTE